jgi:hypothetical protein
MAILILAGPGHIFELASFQRLYLAVETWFDRTLGTDHSEANGSQ